MEVFVKLRNDFRPLIIFAKNSILDIWQNYEYISAPTSFD